MAFHTLVCGIQGVAPGRGLVDDLIPDSTHARVRDKLTLLRQLSSEQLIDSIIALEYQRKLLDKLIEE